MIPAEHSEVLVQFPIALQQLIQDELAAGNSIVEISKDSPAPPKGACVKLAKRLLSRPRVSDHRIRFYIHERNPGSGEISDKNRIFFILEPPLSPGEYPDMNAIRAALEAEQRIADADMDRSSRS